MEIEKSHWACQVVHLMLIKFLLSMRNDSLLRKKFQKYLNKNLPHLGIDSIQNSSGEPKCQTMGY